jgi:hypothetical protein
MGVWALLKRVSTGSNIYGDPDVTYVNYQIEGEIQPVRHTDVLLEPGYDLRDYYKLLMPAQQTLSNSIQPSHLDIVSYQGGNYLVVDIQDFSIGNIVAYRRAILRRMTGEQEDV